MNRKLIFGADPEVRLDLIKEHLDIEDLLVQLGMENILVQGSEIWARCPFHDDGKRHWSINNDLDGASWGLHSCFVCKESGGYGNVVSLVRRMLRLKKYTDALLWLEDFVGIKATEESVLDLTVKKRLKRSRKEKTEAEGEEDPGKLYARMRPLQAQSDGWKYLIDRGVLPEQISARGTKSGSKRYAGRVVFPIYSSGVVVNFYARSFTEQKPKGLYAKKKGTISTTLWGLERANKLIDTCYLVEGVFDVLTTERLLREAGEESYCNCFATNGPIVHEAQAKLLKSFPVIVVIPDMMGKAKSLVPTAKKFLGNNHELLIVQPPRGMDFDDWGISDPENATAALLNPVQINKSDIVVKVNYTIRN